MVRRLLLPTFLAAWLLAGCSSDGRELVEPRDWQTTTTRPPPPTSAPSSQVGESGIAISSPEFAAGGPVPIDLTCAGANRAPALEWSGVPDDAAELAVALADQTDPESPLLLWLVAGLDPSSNGMSAGLLPAGAVQPLNDYGQPGWGNPCLDTFSEGRLDLQFRIYVLSQPSNIADGDPGNEAWDTVAALANDSATILMTVDGSP